MKHTDTVVTIKFNDVLCRLLSRKTVGVLHYKYTGDGNYDLFRVKYDI